MSLPIIVDSFDHFKKEVEPILNDKNRRRHLFLILSLSTAKFSYNKRPSVIWSKSKKCYVCPTCGQPLYRLESEGKGRNKKIKKVFLVEHDFTKEYAYNQICMNTIKVWDNTSKTWVDQLCKEKLWAPSLKEGNEDWIKLPKSMGWYERKHLDDIFEILIAKETLEKKESKLLEVINDVISEEANLITVAPRKVALATYLREKYKKKIDVLIADEIQLYKGGNSEQGQAFSDLIQASKKTICLTGTLLNGYANSLFYILYRTSSHIMQREGFDFNSENEFAREYGIVKNTQRYNRSTSKKLGGNQKILPGISPLVFSKFLLENSAFISLDDISDGLPAYEEIPVPIQMDSSLQEAYEQLELDLKRASIGNKRLMGSLVQALSVYPDMPYDQPPILDPKTGESLVRPSVLSSDMLRAKEEKLIEIVKDKIELGEKVLIYYHWTNKTNVDKRLPDLLAQEGLNVSMLKSTTTSSQNREVWIEQQLDKDIDVLICNPTLVETGLDLLAFTTIIYYQVGYNLFTLRQSCRRSWRLSQTKDIEVYFLFYSGTIQEQALALMASKLQASKAIEGKFSEEGLHALSNSEDLLTQIANSIVQGIEHTVTVDLFNKVTNVSKEEDPDEILLADIKENRKRKEAISFVNYTIFPKEIQNKKTLPQLSVANF